MQARKESRLSVLPQGENGPTTMTSLMRQKASSLNTEIAKVREALGQERANVFETYLQTRYPLQRIGSVLPQTTNAQAPQGRIKPKPETVSFGNGTPCSGDMDLDDGGTIEICTDAQISYISGNEAELYSDISWGIDDPYGWEINEDDDSYVNGYLEENTGVNCHNYIPDASCWWDGQLNSGNGYTYDWATIGSIDLLYDCTDWDGDTCLEWESENVYGYESDPPASVTIYYPDINNLSEDTFTQGKSGSFTIDGQYLESAFENTPTVTVSNSSIFTTFEVSPPSSYPDGDITVTYVVSASAPTGEYYLTVNNGFGSDSYDFTVQAPPPPTITSIAVNGVVNAPLLAGEEQTVTLTGTDFGTLDNVTVYTDGEYVTCDACTNLTVGSVVAPSGTRGTPTGRGTRNSNGRKGAKPNTTDTVSFTVTTAADAPSGDATFDLQTNDGAQNPNVTTPDFTVDAFQPPVPIIWFNGQAVTGTPSVFVGQMIALQGCINPSGDTCVNLPEGLSVTTSSWTAPTGTVIAGYVNAAGDGPPDTTGGRVLPVAAGNAQNYTFYWISPGSSLQTTYTYTLSDGTTNKATVKFNVTGPTATASGGKFFTATPKADAVNVYLQGDTQWLRCGNAVYPNSCIGFDVAGTPPDGSSANAAFQFVQIWNSSTAKYRTAPPTSNVSCLGQTCPGLDNTYPYSSTTGAPNNPSTNDSPGIELSVSGVTAFGEAAETFNAIMYLLWDPGMTSPPGGDCTTAYTVQNGNTFTSYPSTCSGSIPVPLGYVSWGFDSGAVNQSDNPVSTSWLSQSCGGPKPADPTVVNSSTFPTWDHTVTNRQ